MNFGKFKRWLMHRDTSFDMKIMEFFQNIFLLAISLLLFFLFYSIADALNSGPIFFIRLGGLILLVLLAGVFTFGKNSFVNLKYGFYGSTNIIKIIVLLILLEVAVLAFQNTEAIGDFFEEENRNEVLDRLNPLYYSEIIENKTEPSPLAFSNKKELKNILGA